MKKFLAVLTAILLVTGVTAPALAGGRGGFHGGGGHFHGGGRFHGGARFHGFHHEGRVFVAPWWPYWSTPYWVPYGPTCSTTAGQWVWDGVQWVWQPPQTVCP
jgi:hypothetical protein